MAAVEEGALIAASVAIESVAVTKPKRPKSLKRARRKQYVRTVLGYRAEQVYRFVLLTIEQTGSAPSYGTICEALGISTKGEVSDIVKTLERRGLISRVGRGRVRSGKRWNRPVLKLPRR